MNSGKISPAATGHHAGGAGEVGRIKLQRACHDFEALFMAQMLKAVSRTGSESGGLSLTDNNPLQEMFEWELARQLSQQSPLGIADALMGDVQDNRSGGDGRIEEGRLDAIVRRTAERHGLDPALVRAVIECESGGDHMAVSDRGARGLMQLVDSTAADMGVADPFDPLENVEGGTAYLKRMLERYPDDIELALAAYNAGPGAVDRASGVPPYAETQQFISRVLNKYHGFKAESAPQPLRNGATGENHE